ncbi:hypothetical protein [Pedococcus sp. P5_B7]
MHTTTTRAQDLIDLAHRHLAAAAAAARARAGDPVAGHTFAAQVELAAATLPPPSRPTDPIPPRAARLVHHLLAAITALDTIDPFDGPADLPLCAWHVHELARIARTQSQQTGTP